MFQNFSFFTLTYSLHLNSPFSPLALLPLYMYLLIAFHVISYQIYTDQKRYNLLSLFRQQLPNSNIVSHLILTCMSWLQPRKGGLHLILKNNGYYDFGVKVGCCGFVGFGSKWAFAPFTQNKLQNVPVLKL